MIRLKIDQVRYKRIHSLTQNNIRIRKFSDVGNIQERERLNHLWIKLLVGVVF